MKEWSTMLLMPLPKGIQDVLLDGGRSVAGPDGLQINLEGMVDLGQGQEQPSHVLPVLWVRRAM